MSCSYDCNCDSKQPHAGHSFPECKNSTESVQCCSENSERLQSDPIVSQPQQSDVNPSDWLDIPSEPLNCPPGLEYLASVDQLLFNQKVEFFAGFEKNVKFDIKNASGQIVYWAAEGNDVFTRCCCGSNRPFDMKVLDGYKREVMHLQRPCTCSGFCGPHFPELLEVSAPPGQLIGKIEEDLSYPQFLIKNPVDDTILRIEGPLCAYPNGSNVEFQDSMFFERTKDND
ncbi:phospholipid scramblase 1-like isoform X2 [Sitodiplosis mosellana]|uniref:phospholipid scramblase 1-like isoform X2 n=1 Tax=Sitodiplosis mosellana TaxID=263140 RepID=UPI002444208F|nr:phospholipid scramblase 1-like isoform X2 [Sitodiplosis mosellana]